MLSRHGSIGGHLFRGEDFPDNTAEDEAYLRDFFAGYAAGRQATTDGGIVGMLQLAQDYAIRQHSLFRTMQQFVNVAEAQWPTIRFRPHPREPRPRIKTRNPLLRRASLWDDVLPAKLIVGVNSTSLYEAVLAGKTVVPLGDTPLVRHDHRSVVREILRRQIPKTETCLIAEIDQRVFRSLSRSF